MEAASLAAGVGGYGFGHDDLAGRAGGRLDGSVGAGHLIFINEGWKGVNLG